MVATEFEGVVDECKHIYFAAKDLCQSVLDQNKQGDDELFAFDDSFSDAVIMARSPNVARFNFCELWRQLGSNASILNVYTAAMTVADSNAYQRDSMQNLAKKIAAKTIEIHARLPAENSAKQDLSRLLKAHHEKCSLKPSSKCAFCDYVERPDVDLSFSDSFDKQLDNSK